MGHAVLPRSKDSLVLRENRASNHLSLKCLLYVDSFWFFFMDTHMCYFEVLQKTDFCKDVFVAITSLLPKNSVLTSTPSEHKPSWLVRLIFLWCLTHISSQPLLFLMGLTVTSPTKCWLMHLRQEWCLVMWVRWHTWNMLKMLSAGFSRIWESSMGNSPAHQQAALPSSPQVGNNWPGNICCVGMYEGG